MSLAIMSHEFLKESTQESTVCDIMVYMVFIYGKDARCSHKIMSPELSASYKTFCSDGPGSIRYKSTVHHHHLGICVSMPKERRRDR